MRIGYARVSTAEQNLNLQLDALKKAKCKRIYEEHGSGKDSARLELLSYA
jgi:DNA invertase Pin-like site-specific DNA recombinase